MIPRPDLLAPDAPQGIEVFQLTREESAPSSHLYMEAQVFTPDSTRFLLHRSAHAHGGDIHDPEHRYLVCDLEDNGELRPITEETGARAPSVSPDGEFVYYFVDEAFPGGGRITLKRVRLDGTEREVLRVIEGPPPGASLPMYRLYPLSTISSDGKRLAISGWLGDASDPSASAGLLVYDLESLDVRLVLQGPSWCNMHPQYSRSLNPEASHDILVQENHGNVRDADGNVVKLTGGAGADIHVIRDDGTDFRDMPWGRDGNEFCQGHQCWRGRSERAITSTSTRSPKEHQLIEGLAAPHAGHVGIRTPGGVRNDLSRDFPNPQFDHFATDIEGRRLVTDCGPRADGGRVFVADLPDQDDAPLRNPVCVARPGSSWRKEAHIHPFLSPDASLGFFNSDESGILQAYMVRGLDGL